MGALAQNKSSRIIAATVIAALVVSAAALASALASTKSYADMLYNISGTLFTNGRYQSAIDTAKKALQLDARPEGYEILGDSYIIMGDFYSAEGALLKAAATRGSARSFYRLGFAQYNLRNYTAAEKSYKRAMELDPNLLFAYDALGTMYLDLGYHQMAEEAFRKGIETNPNDPKLHNGLGVAYQRTNRYEFAEAEYRKALELDPGYADARKNLNSMLNKTFIARG